ncbi:YgzB family protein [Pseudogracilibacillus auburnensis]|nr:YgzB family protein [Pseudogracilibacillus auburnensis]
MNGSCYNTNGTIEGGFTLSEPQLVYKSKINKIRGFALSLIFIGIAVMYGGILTKKIPWLMVTFFTIGVLFVILSTVVYFWIGLLSTKAIPIICPSCEKPTKMLGRVDACMHCKQPLTLDKELEGKEFDEKYNTRKYRRQSEEQRKQ